MKAITLLGLIMAATFCASAEAVGSARVSTCGPKVTFLVWPHGHPAMQYADFPEIRNTHIDIYLGFAKTYPDSRAGAYVIAGKPPAGIPNGDVIGPCLNYGTSVAKPGLIAKSKTISKPATVDCTFPSSGVIDIVDGPARSETFILHNGSRTFATGHVVVGAATLTVTGVNCKVSAPPTH